MSTPGGSGGSSPGGSGGSGSATTTNQCNISVPPATLPVTQAEVTTCTVSQSTASTVVAATVLEVSSGVQGAVSIMDLTNSPNKLALLFSLNGLPANDQGTINIQTATACSSGSGAQFYTPTNTPSPWTSAVWKSDPSGSASGFMIVASGYTTSEMIGHALEIKANGVRTACGLLVDATTTSSDSSSDLSSLQLALLVCGWALLVVVCAVGGLWWCVCRNREKEQNEEPETGKSTATDVGIKIGVVSMSMDDDDGSYMEPESNCVRLDDNSNHLNRSNSGALDLPLAPSEGSDGQFLGMATAEAQKGYASAVPGTEAAKPVAVQPVYTPMTPRTVPRHSQQPEIGVQPVQSGKASGHNVPSGDTLYTESSYQMEL